jgi:hypothetical protein
MLKSRLNEMCQSRRFGIFRTAFVQPHGRGKMDLVCDSRIIYLPAPKVRKNQQEGLRGISQSNCDHLGRMFYVEREMFHVEHFARYS